MDRAVPVSSAFEVVQFLQRVDIVKRSFIGKRHFDQPVACVPRSDLALAGGQEALEVVGQ